MSGSARSQAIGKSQDKETTGSRQGVAGSGPIGSPPQRIIRIRNLFVRVLVYLFDSMLTLFVFGVCLILILVVFNDFDVWQTSLNRQLSILIQQI